MDVNVMGSEIGQGTDDYPGGPEDVAKEWRTPDNCVNMSMGSNIVYTWASNTIYVMINGSEDGQFESLTGSTSAIMSKETRDQKTLSVADSLNRDRDTINNSVNRETIGNEQTAIRSGEPSSGSYGNNGYTRKSNGEDDDSEYSDVGSDDDNGEDDDSIPLVEHEGGVADTTNFNSVGMRHNDGEQSGNADRYAHRINVFEICNELTGIVESVNEEHLVSNVLRQLYPNNRQQFATVYLDEDKEIWISFKMKHDGRIKARIVCAGR